MKKLNLNIKLDESVKDDKDKDISAPQVTITWIGQMVERAINVPQFNSSTDQWVPTKTSNMDVQRKYGKTMDAHEAHKKGIAEMEDDTFSFLQSKWNQAGISVQRDVNKILRKIDSALNRANVKE